MIVFSENAVRNLVSDIADIAFKKAKEYSPVKTGKLKNSITCVKGEREAMIFTNVDYAAKVELGTGRQRAQPYLSRGINDAAKLTGIFFRKEFFGND